MGSGSSSLTHAIDGRATIMIIDDDPVNTHFLSEALLKEGFLVRAEQSAKIALASALAEPPDLILLDIKMPDMDGITLCQKLKKESIASHIPVIFISTLEKPQEKVRAFNAGGSDYLTKPVAKVELLARVHTHLNLSHLQLRLEKLVELRSAELETENTKHKQAEEQIYKLSAAVEQNPASIIITNAEGKIEYVNNSFTAITGFSRKEALGQNPNLLKSGETPQAVYNELWQTVLSGKNWRGELLNKNKDGTLRCDDVSISPLKNAKEEITHLVGVQFDITDSKQTSNDLECIRHQQSLILNSAGEGIYGQDAQGNTMFVNKAAAEMLGYSIDDLIGKPMHKLVHHSHADGSPYPREECPMYAAVTDGKTHTVTDEVLWRKDGSSFPVEYTSTPINEKGQLVGAVVTFRDITERILTENHLNEIRQRHEEAQQIAHLGHWTLDLINNELVWSDENYRIFGLEPGTGNTYETFLETVHPDDRELVNHAYTNSVKNRSLYNIEHRLLMKDGSRKWVNERGQTHYAEDGTPVSSTGTTLDITERKITEEKLRENQARLSGILEYAAEAVISIDESQRITMFNNSAENIFGYSRDEILGQPLEILIPEEYHATHKSHVADFASTQKQGRYMAERDEIKGRRKSGDTFPIEASISKLEIGGKKTFTAVLRDISRRKQYENRLRSSFVESIDTLMRAAEYRDDETGAHVRRISYYTRALAEELGLDNNFCDDIYHASAMHDIGKIGIPDHILLKPSGFTPDEWELMKTHTLIGGSIMAGNSSPYLQLGEQIALSHHERWDGGGYPYGLKGDAIPLAARIMQLADVYDALRSKRPYKKAFDHTTSLEIITKGDGRTDPSHFDPDVLAAFQSCADTMNEIFEEHRALEASSAQ